MWRLTIKRLLIWLLFLSPQTMAGQISVQSSLHFGEIVVRDNSREHVYSITPDGIVSVDSGMVVIDDGQPGEYLLFNFPPNTQINLTIDTAYQPVSYFGGNEGFANFKVNIYTFTNRFTTNELGEVVVSIGSNLVTDGTGKIFKSGTYYNTHSISLDY